jgi:hypothetical protein
MQHKLNILNKQIEKSTIYKEGLLKNRENLVAIMAESYVSKNPDPDKALCEEIIENAKISNASKNGKGRLDKSGVGESQDKKRSRKKKIKK